MDGVCAILAKKFKYVQNSPSRLEVFVQQYLPRMPQYVQHQVQVQLQGTEAIKK